MRPGVLNPLFADASTLQGVGPRIETLLKKALGLPATQANLRLLDLLWHTPTGLIDRRAEPAIQDAVPGTIATFRVRVVKHRPSPRGRAAVPYRVTCEDDSGRLDLIFFRAERSYVERQLPEGEIRYVSGKVERYGDQLQMPHPDYILPEARQGDLPMLEPVYPLTAGLSAKVLGKLMRQMNAAVPQLAEWQTHAWLEARGWPGFHDAISALHRPRDPADLSPSGPAWQRLAYDELLAGQVALALVRANQRAQRGRAVRGDGRVRRALLEALPFALTRSQAEAMAVIEADMASDRRMLRLLQGDVGAGKTVVALLAMAIAVEAGMQAALMAPTEVLARQHMETLSPLADAAGLKLALLTGREKGKTRTQTLAQVTDGSIDILVGTHALFQADVVFNDLGFAVIDEQHRFGVHQRMALQTKGRDGGANVLVMTATPIPRTLLMTHYGDLEVSKLTEKPAGRKPIVTTAPPLERLSDVIEALKRAVKAGAQIYWVCPLVESSDKSELAAAQERAAHLGQTFGDRVGLLHGQMKGADKDAVMARFAADELSILVATTVIEVGVNVPNATVMVIEHAERFGLAQLHQLRGRVGRGAAQSYCMLLHKAPLGEVARERIDIMCQSEDGFLIAEKDLELRGGGEVLGARQSGVPAFRMADVPGMPDLLAAARDDSTLIVEQDPTLQSPRGQALRTLLYLFERDEAVRLFRTG
ncbi:MAG: ATP-dependent DNA helicase RecG [Pseudomonadota bacterium]